jgi:streptomycin 3"-adenylyltransferase
MIADVPPLQGLALTRSDLEQLRRLLASLEDVLGPRLLGAYLHGSAVLGGLRARSDIDVLAVSERRLTRWEKAQMIAQLLAVSGPDPDAAPPRPLELTLVVASEIRPWRYPPEMDLQFGEWWRDEFERGELEPWPSRTNPDLAVLIRMARDADVPLSGPSATTVLDPVPGPDFVRALVAGIPELVAEIGSDTSNVVLTLARIWNGVVTGAVRPKDAAADWALPQLPAQHRSVLERARDIYLGTRDQHWEGLQAGLPSFVAAVLAQIETAEATGGLGASTVARETKGPR